MTLELKAPVTPESAIARRKYLFVFSHDIQIRWYSVFAHGFKECGDEYRTAIFVHGQADACLARQLGCYDEVYDLLEGFEFDQNLTIGDLAVSQNILALEEECGSSFFWEDIRTDRWTRAKRDPSYYVQYLNHATSIVSSHFERLGPVAALGEYTMAIYRYAQRLFQRHGKPMFYPITTRYFEHLYFETSLSWDWERCMDLYHKYVEHGVPDALLREVRPFYENIAVKYTRPTYTNYQSNFTTGFVEIHKLRVSEILKKIARSFVVADRRERRQNPRLALNEKGPLDKLVRIARERRNLHIYRKVTSKILPQAVKYGVYFLHYQPEYTSEALGKFYMDQQFLINNIASSLPGDMYLVVKEHPTMVGLRDAEVYRKIRESPNVILVDHAFDSIELIKRSSIVFTIVGTPALEAMFIGKPAIMFGKYAFCKTNLITFCPDFWAVNEMVRDKLMEAEASPLDVEKHAIALLAAKYESSRLGQIPIATELVESFLRDRENRDRVKRSFQDEIKRIVQ